MQIRSDLSKITKGLLSNEPLNPEDSVLTIMDRVGEEYREIIATIPARKTPVSFEELYGKLVNLTWIFNALNVNINRNLIF